VPDVLPEPDLVGVALLGVGGAVLGLVGLLGAVGRKRQRVPHGWVALVLLVPAVAPLALGMARSVWLPALGLFGTCALIQGARSDRLGRAWAAAARLLKSPSLQWATVMVACPALALGWACRAEPDSAMAEDEGAHWPSLDPAALDPVAGVHATTDRGQPLPLFRYPNEPDVDATLPTIDDSVSRYLASRRQLIRTGNPDLACNCHGWVFAGGRYWVRGREVARVLDDNGYLPVATPRVNDLIVYRDADGNISHTGLVRATGEGGLVLIESKWSWLGRYVHPPESQPYGAIYRYYHSGRAGHKLLTEPSLTSTPAPPPDGKTDPPAEPRPGE
jgi:hypothetical protein